MPVRTTVHLEEDVLVRVRQLVPSRGLSRFINETLAEKLDALERQRVEDAMREGYIATRDDHTTLDEGWTTLDTMDWPE
jgi:hypothetical protein